MSEVLIKVDGVSKKFCRSLKKSLWYGMQDLGNEVLGRRHGGDGELRLDEFWAVKDVSFELKRGECLGLIGHNGAGKTTLLRMLNGLIKPDQGRIEMRGRVGALIALGAGFNPILTGRENIYVNASVLGLSKREIDEKFDEIVDFAEIGEFIDAPVQNYSSGMQVRLGFAVATALNPDILLLDEVLAVGDIAFQVKCGNRIRTLANNSAVIFVSHSMQYISSFCSRALLMAGGFVDIDTENTAQAIQQYSRSDSITQEMGGTLEVKIEKFLINSESHNNSILIIKQGEHVSIEMVIFIKNNHNCIIRINIIDAAQCGVISFPILTEDLQEAIFTSGRHNLKIPLGAMELNFGTYNFLVAVNDVNNGTLLLRHYGLCSFEMKANNMNSIAKIIRPVIALSL